MPLLGRVAPSCTIAQLPPTSMSASSALEASANPPRHTTSDASRSEQGDPEGHGTQICSPPSREAPTDAGTGEESSREARRKGRVEEKMRAAPPPLSLHLQGLSVERSDGSEDGGGDTARCATAWVASVGAMWGPSLVTLRGVMHVDLGTLELILPFGMWSTSHYALETCLEGVVVREKLTKQQNFISLYVLTGNILN
jgi:hypothetical protein